MGPLKKIRHEKMIAQNGCCYYCGLKMWEGRGGRRPRALQCTAEHLHARCDGGQDRAENIVAACLFCNQARHRGKKARSPKAHREHVQRRLADGRWHAGPTASS